MKLIYGMWGIVKIVLKPDEMAGTKPSKPLLTEFGIHDRLESCVYYLEGNKAYEKQFL